MNIIQQYKSKDSGDRFLMFWEWGFTTFTAICLLPPAIVWMFSDQKYSHPPPPKYNTGDIVYLKPDSAIAVVADDDYGGRYLVTMKGWKGVYYATDDLIYGKKSQQSAQHQVIQQSLFK